MRLLLKHATRFEVGDLMAEKGGGPVRVRIVPPRHRQKRHFKACRRRAGRHHRMPPARYGARIHVEWEPFDPARLMVMVAGAIQERRL